MTDMYGEKKFEVTQSFEKEYDDLDGYTYMRNRERKIDGHFSLQVFTRGVGKTPECAIESLAQQNQMVVAELQKIIEKLK